MYPWLESDPTLPTNNAQMPAGLICDNLAGFDNLDGKAVEHMRDGAPDAVEVTFCVNLYYNPLDCAAADTDAAYGRVAPKDGSLMAGLHRPRNRDLGPARVLGKVR